MMSNDAYPLQLVGEVAETLDSQRIPVKAADRNKGQYPYYGAQGVVDYVDNYIFDGLHVLVAEDGENLRTRNQDIAFLAKGKFWVNNHAHILKGDSDISTKFLKYALNSSNISGYVTGSTIPKLSQKNLHSIPVFWPDVNQQTQVVSLLGGLDEKIEANQRMNETLEAMAQAIFRDWFVNFGPTRAKMEGRAPYLVPDLWKLFPDKLDDEGKPKGWGTFRLEEIACLHKKTISPFNHPDIGFEHYSIPAFDRNKMPILEKGAAIKSNKTLIPKESVLLSKLNPDISRVWMPELANRHQQISSTEFLPFTTVGETGLHLLYCLFSSGQFQQILQSMVTGTSKSHQRVSPKDLLLRKVIVGSLDIFEHFESTVNSCMKCTLINLSESRSLAQTRDILLPEVMSGKIQLLESQKHMEAIP